MVQTEEFRNSADRVGEVKNDNAVLFCCGGVGVGKAYHPRGKNESHNVSSLVMIGCVIKPEKKTRSSGVFTLSSLRERSSLRLVC